MKKHNNTLSNVGFILKYIWKKNKLSLVVLFIPITSSVLISVTNVLGFKLIIDSLEKKQNLLHLTAVIFLFLLLNVVSDILHSIYNEWLLPKTSLSLSKHVNLELMKKAACLDIECYDNSSFFNKYTRALSEANSRMFSVLNTLSSFLGSLLSMSTIIIIISNITPIVLIFSISSVILGFLASMLNNRISFKKDNEITFYTRIQSYIHRVLYQKEYAEEIRHYPSIVSLLLKKYTFGVDQQYLTTMKYALKKMIMELLHNTCAVLPVFASMLYIGPMVLANKITIGQFTANFNAVNNLSMNLSKFFNSFVAFNRHSLYIENLRLILDYEPKIKNHNEGKKLDSISLLEMKNVSFCYPDTDRIILSDISLKIREGEKIALVGHNGAGKSSLIKLLNRLYDPMVGEIILNGQNIKEFNIQSLRNNIGMVFQNYKMYALSIAENVLMRELQTEEDEFIVIQALKKSGLYEYVKSLPEGIKTNLTREFYNEGEVISGGQMQKLAISRIYAANHNLVILDEPSAALDPLAEYDLNQQIMGVGENRTIIIISHRLTCVTMVDRIYLLDNGRILEEGSHESLMKKNGRYAQIYTMQKESYNAGYSLNEL